MVRLEEYLPSMQGVLGSIPRLKLGMVAHEGYPRILELDVQGHFKLYSEFQDSIGYIKPCLQRKTNKTKENKTYFYRL